MPVSNLGRIGFVMRGDWSAGPYKYLDVVTYNRSTWICAVPETSQEPGYRSDWQNALSVPSVIGLTKWNELSGEKSPPLIVYDDNKYWSLTSTVSNIALNKPADSPAFFKDISDSYIDDSSISADKTWSSEKINTTKRDLANTSFPRYDLSSTSTTDTLDLSLSQVFRVDASVARTLAFANAPGANRAMTVVIHISGNSAVTWPAGIDWDGGSSPGLGDNETKVVLFWDGIEWSGFTRVAK